MRLVQILFQDGSRVIHHPARALFCRNGAFPVPDDFAI